MRATTCVLMFVLVMVFFPTKASADSFSKVRLTSICNQPDGSHIMRAQNNNDNQVVANWALYGKGVSGSLEIPPNASVTFVVPDRGTVILKAGGKQDTKAMNNIDCPIDEDTGEVEESVFAPAEPVKRTYPVAVWYLPPGTHAVRWIRTDDGENWYDIVDDNDQFLTTPVESREVNGQIVLISRLTVHLESIPDHAEYKALAIGEDTEVGVVVSYHMNHCIEFGC